MSQRHHDAHDRLDGLRIVVGDPGEVSREVYVLAVVSAVSWLMCFL